MSAGADVVVTGAGGQVGRALRRGLPDARFYNHAGLDVTDADAVSSTVVDADVVVHLAAMTNVDGCESNAEKAHEVNAQGTRNVADAAVRTGARVIYVSTDYVFDGTKRGDYEIDDDPNPINEYGRTKYEGEKSVARNAENLIVRTSSVFGQGKNFVRTIIEAARAGKDLCVVDDQVSRPSAAFDVARAIAHLVTHPIPGILHVAGEGSACSWAELAQQALTGAKLNVPVTRIDSAEYAESAGRVIAQRPVNSVLSLEAARGYGVPLGDWRTSLRQYVETLA